jgi:hypothetical protein
VRRRDHSGCAAARPKRSPIPPKRPHVTYTPTTKNATSFTTDSTATAVMRPVWCLVKSRFLAPKRMPKSASVHATRKVGSKMSSTDSSRRIIVKETDTALSWSAMYGIIPPTTSRATRVPSGADFP